MKLNGIGTLAWDLRTGGKLSRLDRLTTIVAAMRYRLVRKLKAAGPAGRDDADRLAAVSLSAIRIPDTAAALDALQYSSSVSPVWLFNHCARSYLFAALLGLVDKLHYDEEMLYVACLLHDLGLTPPAAAHGAHCFAVAGGRTAEARAALWHWPAARRRQLRAAIVLHTNVTVPLQAHGVEAHLLNAGAGVDVTGARLRELPSGIAKQVLQQHPRTDFGVYMADAMREEAAQRPHSRIALYERFGFSRLIASTRLD